MSGCYVWKPVPSTHMRTVLKEILKEKTIVYMDSGSGGSIWSLENVRVEGDSLYGLIVRKSLSLPDSEMKAFKKMGYESIMITRGSKPVELGENTIALSLNDIKNVRTYSEDKSSKAGGVAAGVLLGVGFTILLVSHLFPFNRLF